LAATVHSLAIPLEPGEVAKITRTERYVFAEKMQLLSLEEARIIARDWHGPVERIQNAVADFYGVERFHMRSVWRHQKVAWPRQRAMWLAKKLLDKPWTDLGRLFGRDHSTIIHGVRSVDQRMSKDAVERAEMHQLLVSLQHLRRHVA
jgi:chromosomal replication initiation ATPase DnaA